MRLAVIGVPTNSSGTLDGVARAPAALWQAGLVELLRGHSDVEDYGDVTFDPPTSARESCSGIIAPHTLTSMVSAVRSAVGRALRERRFPVVLGGDCPLLLGCLAAVHDTHSRVRVLFVDGHEDAYPPHQSPTGEAADMELGLALGRGLAGVPTDLADLLPLVSSADVALMGPRDAGILRAEGVPSLAGGVELYSDVSLQAGPIDQLGREVLSRLQGQDSPVWLHVDLDVLSEEALPAVDYLQTGGLSWSQLDALTATAMKADALIGWNVTIYNPDLDAGGACARRIAENAAAASVHLAAKRH